MPAKISVFLFFLFFDGIIAEAQRLYAPGFMVTNAGDTLRGFIEQREMDVNPSVINFKTSLEAEDKTFSVSDISYFFVTGASPYKRFDMAISMDPVELKYAKGYTAPAYKTVFLKVIQQGKLITLLSYQDDLKIRFYILHGENNQPQDLVYKILRVENSYAERFAFRDLLMFIAERSGMITDKLRHLINKINYNEQQILKVVSQINGIEEKKVPIAHKASTGFRAGAGLSISRLHYYEDDEFARNAQSSPSTMYWFSIGYDLAKNPVVGAMVFRTDLTLSFAEFTTITYDYRFSSDLNVTHAFKQRTISAGLYGLYNLYNKEKLKLFLSVGIRANFSSYITEYELRRTSVGVTDKFGNRDAEPRRLWSSIPVKMGLVIRKKIEIGVTYNPTRVLSYGDFIYKYGINSLQAGGVYHF